MTMANDIRTGAFVLTIARASTVFDFGLRHAIEERQFEPVFRFIKKFSELGL